jgi:soluble lytic murein transglycosylase
MSLLFIAGSSCRSYHGAMMNARDRSRWAVLSSIAVLLAIGPWATPGRAQALDAATIARYRALLASNEAGRAALLPASPLIGGQGQPLLDDVVTWDRLRRESAKAPFADYAAFLPGHAGWPQAGTLRRLAERAITDATPADAVVRHFRRVAPLTAEGKGRFAEALAATGQANDAVIWARDAWDSAGLDDAQEARLFTRFGPQLRLQDHVGRMDRLLWADRTTPGARMLPRVETDVRLWALARIALRRNAPDVGARLAVVPDRLRREAGLLLDEAQWLSRQSREKDAIALLATRPTPLVAGELLTQASESWLRIRLDIARRLWRAGNHADARAVLAGNGLDAAAMAKRPVAERALFLDSEWLAGWLALRQLNQPGQALTHFRNARAVAQSPISQARGDYWAGRAAEAAGQRDVARQFFAEAARHPDYFYGQLASERLAQPLQLAAQAQPAPALPAADVAALRAEPLVRVATMLGDVDRDRQTIFLRHLAATADTPQRAAGLAAVATTLGRMDLGVNAAKAVRDSAGLSLLAASFPVLPLPDSLTPRFAIIHAITRQESQFDRGARSSANAIGMMQLVPATAAEQAQKMGLPASPTSRLSEDPVWNVTLGSGFIQRLRDSYGGSAPLAVAAYNAGPGNVRRFLAQIGDPRTGDVIDWIEAIPFAETRNYVQRVLENAVVYETLHPDKAVTRPPNRLSQWLGKQTPG